MEQFKTFPAFSGDIQPHSIATTRNFKGFYQFSKTSNLKGKTLQQWCFVIMGFSICGTEATVCKWDNTLETVPVDSHGNVIIHDERYSNNNWVC